MNYKKILITVVLGVFASMTAYAGDISNTSSSTNKNNSTSNSGSYNGGLQNQQNFITNNPGEINYKGGYNVNNVPSLGLGAFGASFSGDYCRGTTQGSVGIAGFGAAYGKQVLDEGCELRRTAEMAMRISSTVRGGSEAAWNFAAGMDKLRQDKIEKYSKMVNGVLTAPDAIAADINDLAKNARQARKIAFEKAAKADALEDGAINIVCSVNPVVRKDLNLAGVQCPTN